MYIGSISKRENFFLYLPKKINNYISNENYISHDNYISPQIKYDIYYIVYTCIFIK